MDHLLLRPKGCLPASRVRLMEQASQVQAVDASLAQLDKVFVQLVCEVAPDMAPAKHVPGISAEPLYPQNWSRAVVPRIGWGSMVCALVAAALAYHDCDLHGRNLNKTGCPGDYWQHGLLHDVPGCASQDYLILK